jgi:hypothetical protein
MVVQRQFMKTILAQALTFSWTKQAGADRRRR